MRLRPAERVAQETSRQGAANLRAAHVLAAIHGSRRAALAEGVV